MLVRSLGTAVVVAATVVSTRTAVAPERKPAPVGGQRRSHFVLRSDPWVNLHHFLYHLARRDLLGQERLRGRVPIRPEDREPVLPPADSARWRQALEVYARYGELDLLRDEAMPQIQLRLTEGPSAFPRGADAEPIYAALESAMPIYRQHWWPRHAAVNQQRLAELQDGLARYESAFAPRLARGVGGSWPERPIRVDLSVYVSRSGAYTMNQPDRIVFASAPSEHPGLLGLEILFHEASHAESMAGPLLRASLEAAKTVGIEEDRLWHATLFYAVAEVARELFANDYVPYAWHYRLFVTGSMAVHLPVLEAHYRAGAALEPMLDRMHRARLERQR